MSGEEIPTMAKKKKKHKKTSKKGASLSEYGFSEKRRRTSTNESMKLQR
jgi:hypothetical protein